MCPLPCPAQPPPPGRWHPGRLPQALGVLCAAGLAVAACSSAKPSSAPTSSSSVPPTSATTTGPTSSTTSTTTASAGPANPPESGTYVDGMPDFPHDFIELTAGPGESVSGTVNEVYQDGRTSTYFSFMGSASSGVAQLTSQDGGPGHFSATYASGTITLSGCTSYLDVPASSCTFTYSPGGQQ